MNDELATRLDELERTNAELRTQIDALAKQSPTSRVTMKKEARCPCCDGRKLIHAPQILDRDQGGRNEMALAQPSLWKSGGLGKIEAFVCAQCGSCELWVKDIAEVNKAMDAGDLKTFRRIDAEPNPGPSGPYR